MPEMDINKIKEVDDGVVPSDAKSRRGSHITSTSNPTVPQKASGVNTQSMQKSEKNTTAESSGEKSTGIRFSKSVQEYPYDMQTVIHEYLTSVDERLKSFCEQAVRNEVTDSARFYFDKVDAMTAKQIESITGIDVSGFKMTIESKQIKHINKRHGINGASDHSMSDMNDIARINYILHNYDNITYGGHSRSYKTPKGNGKNKNADTVLYSKKINGTYYLVQAIPDSKQRTLYIVTAYINKKGTSQFIDAKSPYETSKNETVSVPDTNIAQGEHGVNTKSMQNNARKSLNVEFDENTDFSENMKKVANMKSVCDLTGNEFAKGDTDLITQVTEYFTKIGNKVDSKYGSVVINRTGVKSSVSHGIGRKKAIAFKAVPSVIENGEIINYKSNYKNRNYDTVVFAAPITISQTPYFVAIVVTVNKNSNEYYLHEVALHQKEDAVPFKTGNSKNATPSDTTSSIYSLLNSLQNVKKSSENNEIRLSKTVEPAKYTYEYFANKPDMQVTEIDDSKVYAASSQTRKEIIDRSAENAKRVGRVNAQGNAVIHVDDIDTDVVVSKSAIKHSLDRRLNILAPVVLNTGNILKNSIRINELAPKKDTIEKSYALIGIAKNKKNEPYVVSFVVNRATNEVASIDVLYAINTKTEPAGSLSPQVSTPATGSTISISELLDYVNKYYPDILPEDVLKHYGHQSRPDGMLGKSALYSRAVDAAEYNSLLKENKQLKQMNSILQQELKPGHHISNSQALKLAHWLKKQRNSKMDAAKLGLQLRNLFDYIGNDENVTMDTVMEMATNIAKSVIDESQTKVLLDDYAQTVLQDIRQYKIKLSDAQKASGVNTKSMQKSEKNTTAESSGAGRYSFAVFESINKENRNNIASRGNVIIENEQQLIDYIDYSLKNTSVKENYYLGGIDEQIKLKIKSDIGADIFKKGQYTFAISSDDIRHISKHFSSPKDITEAIYRLYDVVNHYDSVEYMQEYGQNRLKFEKSYSDYDYLSIEIASKKNRCFDLVTFYITKNNKKSRIQNDSPANTSKVGELASKGVSSPANPTVPQKASGVNTQSMQKSEKNTTAESSGEKSTGIRFSKSVQEYPYDMQTVIHEYINSVDKEVLSFYQKNKNKAISKPLFIQEVTPQMVNEIFDELNVDASEYQIKIEGRMAQHISKEHGQNGQKDHSMSDDNDVARIKYIINNHDYYGAGTDTNAYKQFVNGKNKNAKTIVFAKKINGTYYIAVAVPETKSKTIWIETAFINKKIEATQFRNASKKALRSTPQSGIESASNNSISNSNENVKKSSENNEIRLSKTVEPAKYTYEYFANKPDMQVTEIDDSKVYAASSQTRKEIIDRSVENAKRVGRVNAQGNAVIHVDDIDTDVVVSKNGIKHGLDRRLNRMAQVTMNIGSILQNSIRINETLPSKKDASGSYVLVGTAKNKTGDLFIVESVINSYTNELNSVNILYSINTKKEPTGLIDPELSSQSDVSLTGSTISISELLDYVNKYYPDILPEDVLKYYGHQSRPDGMLGKSALYSRAVDAAEYNSLLKENKQLKQMNSILQQELKPGHHISNSQALKLAHWLKKQRNSKMDAAKLGLQLRNLFDYIGNDENVTMDTVMEMATNIAKSVIDESQTKVLLDDYAQTVLQDIRSYKIKLSDAQKAEARHQYGNLHAFNRHLMGRVRVGEDGMSLDQAWQELAELHPGIFDTGMPEADQGIALAQTLDMLKESYVDNGMNYEDSAVALAYEIFDRYFEIPEYKTYAQRQNDKYDQLQGKYRKALHDVKAEYKDRYERRLREVKTSAKAKQQQQRNAYMNWKQKHAAGAATIQDKNLYQQYKAILGAHSPKSLDEFLKIKYNIGDEWEQFKAYALSIKSGELTPLADFDLYKNISKQIDDRLIGLTTANGILITGKSNHFIARIIGSLEQRRNGVLLNEVISAIQFPEEVTQIRINENGRSQKFKNKSCAVTVNPDTGNLIQTNPRKRGEKAND